METARQLASGKWQGRFTGPDGKRRTAGTHKTKREAEKAAALKLAEVTRGETEAQKDRGTNFATFAERYIYSRRPGQSRAYAPSTYYKAQKKLAILNRTFGEHHLEDITPHRVRAWWDSYDHAPSARRDYYQLLKDIFNVAMDDELIVRNPCRVKDASADVSKRRPTFTESDVATLYFATDDPQMRAFLTLLSGTAMRVGEAVALDWENLSFLDRRADVVRHLTPHGMQDGTKTGTDETRSLALPTWVTDELETLYTLRADAGEAEGPIFRNSRGGRMTVDTAERLFRRLRAKVGLDGMHLHDFRHVSLTAYGRQPGVTLADIKARGGHKSDAVAMRYQHSDSERDHMMTATLPNPMRKHAV